MRALLGLLMLVPALAQAEPKAALVGDVLVWADARFYLEPSEQAPSFQYATLAQPRADSLGQVIAFHVVGTKGAFVEVTPTASVSCAWTRPGTSLEITNLRLFVPRTDLAPVLVKAVAQTFPDGTRFALEPGTAVVKASDGYVVSFAGDEATLPIPDAAVGFAYAPAKPRAAAPGDDPGELVMLGGGTVTLGARAIPIRAELRYPHIASKPAQAADPVLFALRRACMSATVAAPAALVRAYKPWVASEGIIGGLAHVSGLGASWSVPAGTPLTTASGRVIAKARDALAFDKPAGGAKRACRDISLWLEPVEPSAPAATPQSATVSVCVPASKLVRTKARSSFD